MPALKKPRYHGLCAAVEHGDKLFDHTPQQKESKHQRRYHVTEKMRKQHPWLWRSSTESEIFCASCYNSLDRQGFIEHAVTRPRKPAIINKQIESELKNQRLKIAAQENAIAELLAKVKRYESNDISEEHSSDMRNLDSALIVDEINLMIDSDDDYGDDFVQEEDEADADNDIDDSSANNQSTNANKFEPVNLASRPSYLLPPPPSIAKIIPHPVPFHVSSFHPTLDISALVANVCAQAMPPLYTVEREPITEPATKPKMTFRSSEPTAVTWEKKLEALKKGKYAEPDKKLKRKIRTYEKKKAYNLSLPKKQRLSKTRRRMKGGGCVRLLEEHEEDILKIVKSRRGGNSSRLDYDRS